MHTTNNTSDSERERPMLDIQSMESTYRLLTNVNLGLLILAGAVALLIGIVSLAVTRRGDEIIRAKDEKLARDLKERDGKISEARLEAAASLERAAKAEQRAAEANLALVRFREQRRLTPDQHKEFVAKLKEFSRTAFDIAGSSQETLVFALSIESALTEAGWDRKSWTGGGNAFNLPGRPFRAGHVVAEGVDIKILDRGLLKPRDALVDLLRRAGFEAVMATLNDVPPEFPDRNVMHIIVGTKP